MFDYKRPIQQFLIIFVILFTLMFVQSIFATPKKLNQKISKHKIYKHKVELDDVGLIESEAPTHQAAFKKTATTCFDKKLALYERNYGEASEDTQLDFIDQCANVSW